MLNAIMGLFTSFNPIIVGLMLSAGAYIALRHRVLPSLQSMIDRTRQVVAAAPRRAGFLSGSF